MNLDLNLIRRALGEGAAFRSRTRLQPAGGAGDKVFPPTYAGAAYAMEERRVPGNDSAEAPTTAKAVLMDSVQSQANRMEDALQEVWESGELKDFLPVVVVDFESLSVGHEEGRDLVEPVANVTSLTAPHRIADAILRDSLLEGEAFSRTALRQSVASASLRNARSLYELCPTALLFGMWDSTGPKGGLGCKFQRALVSEIVGINAQVGVRTSSRIDPLQIRASVRVKTLSGGDWMVAEEGGDKGTVRPSEINHGNIVPSISEAGGVTIDYAEQTTVLSLPAIRRLRFPKIGGRPDARVDHAGQAVLVALGLYAATLATQRGMDLRSRCLLCPEEAIRWEWIGSASAGAEPVEGSAEVALATLKEAVAAAEAVGLTWRKEPLVLKPSPQLIALLRASQLRALQEAGGDESAES